MSAPRFTATAGRSEAPFGATTRARRARSPNGTLAGRCTIARGRPDRPVTTLDGEVARLRAYLFGRESLDQAEDRGLTVHGNRTIARRLPKLFEVPR